MCLFEQYGSVESTKIVFLGYRKLEFTWKSKKYQNVCSPYFWNGKIDSPSPPTPFIVLSIKSKNDV